MHPYSALLAILVCALAGCQSSVDGGVPPVLDAGRPEPPEPEETKGAVDEACVANPCGAGELCSGGKCLGTMPETEPSTPPPPPGVPACDVTKPWATPAPVGALGKLVSPGGARLDANLLGVWLHGSAAEGAKRQLYFASRPSVADPFGVPVAQKALGAPEAAPGWASMAPDGLTLYFDSSPTGVYQIYYATRPSPASPFGAPQPVSGLADAMSTAQPFVQGDGTALYFISARAIPGAFGAQDIYRAALVGPGLVGAMQHVPELSAVERDSAPVVSADGLTVWFARQLAVAGGTTQYAIFSAARPNALAAFGKPRQVPELNSARNELPTWITADGCTLYLSSDRDGNGYKVYLARRPR